MCICIADSLCSTVETNATLYINYTPVKFEKNIGINNLEFLSQCTIDYLT